MGLVRTFGGGVLLPGGGGMPLDYVGRVGGLRMGGTTFGGVGTVTPGGQSATVNESIIFPGNPAQSLTVAPNVQVNTNRLFEVPISTNFTAGGEFFEASLGQVYDIVDASATAIAVNEVDVVLPDGQVMDFVFLTRPKTVEAFMKSVPPGIWRFMNVKGAAVASKVVGIWHLAPRNQLVM